MDYKIGQRYTVGNRPGVLEIKELDWNKNEIKWHYTDDDGFSLDYISTWGEFDILVIRKHYRRIE